MFKLSDRELHFIKHILLTVVLGSFVGLFNYFFNIYVARYTTANIFGIFSAAMGIVYLLQIPILSIQAILTKTVGEQKNVDWKNFKVRSLLIFTLIGLVVSTIFYLAKDSVVDIANIPTEAILPLAFVLLGSFISPIPKGMLLGQEKIVTVNLLLLLETAVKFIMGYIAIQTGGNVNLLILANALPSVVIGLIALLFIKFEKKKAKNKPSLNYKELILMTVSFLLLSTPYTLDIILVNPELRAEYSALTLIGKIVFFGSTTISTVMFARLVNQKKSKNEKRTLLISLFVTLLVGLGLSTVFFIFKDTLSVYIFDGKYNGISTLIPIYSVCMALYAFVYMAVNFLMSEGSYWFNVLFILTAGLQMYLFSTFNTDLKMIVKNQVYVYLSLFVLIGMSVLVNVKKVTESK